MHYKKYLLCIAFLMSFNGYTGEIETNKSNKNKELSQTIEEYFTQKDLNLKLKQGKQLLLRLEKSADKHQQLNVLTEQITLYLDLEKYKDSIALTTKALKIADLLNSQKSKFDILSRLGEAYWNQGDLEKALFSLRRALRIAKKVGLQPKIASATMNIGLIYRQLGDTKQTLSHYLRAIKIKEAIGTSHQSLANTYNNLGVVYYELENDKLAEQSFNKSLEYFASDINANITQPLHNIGKIYQRRGDYVIALNYFNESLALEKKINNQKGVIVSFVDIGKLYIKLDDLKMAEKYLSQAYSLSKNYDSAALMAEVEVAYAKIFTYSQNYERAIKLLKSAIRKSFGSNHKIILREAYFELAKQYEMTNQYQHALKNYTLYHQTDLVITESQAKKDIVNLQIQSEIDFQQQQSAIKIKQAELEQLALDKELILSRIGLIITFTIFIAIVAFLIIFILRRSVHRKEVLNKELLALDNIKDNILSSTSHELLTPINGIIGLTESIQFNERQLTDESKQSLRVIRSCGDRLTNLVKNILDLSSLKRNQLSLHLQKVDIVNIVHESVILMTPLAEEKSLTIIENLPINKVMLTVDAAKMEQILFNVIGNAIKYTDKGSITISLYEDVNDIKIEVKDTGIGIPSDKGHDIFSEFYQVEKTNNKYGGSGLGLTISKELIELHAGTISYLSQINNGSVFTITLPKPEIF